MKKEINKIFFGKIEKCFCEKGLNYKSQQQQGNMSYSSFLFSDAIITIIKFPDLVIFN
jgi:hypothetical protein